MSGLKRPFGMSTTDELLWQLIQSVEGISTGPGGGLTSFNGRTTPAAVPTAGDYDVFYYTKAQSDSRYLQSIANGSITNAMLAGGIDLTAKVSGLLPDANIASASAWNAKLTSPLTTKGDILAYSNTNTRLGVGANGAFLKADSTQATGLGWNLLTPSDIPDKNPQLGSLYSISGTQWNASSIGTNFAKSTANGTAVFGSNKLTLSNGIGGYTDIVYYSLYKTCLSDYSITAQIGLDTVGNAGPAISLFKGTSEVITFQLDTTTATTSKLRILFNGVDVNMINNDLTLACSASDVVTFTITVIKNRFVFSVKNETQASKPELTISYNAHYYNTGNSPGVNFVGFNTIASGAYSVNSLSAYSKVVKYADLCFVGDSYLEGKQTLNNEQTLPSLIESRTSGTIITWSRQGNTISDLIASQSELLALAPKNVYLNICTNDISGTPATVFTSYQAFVTTLTNAGINVYFGKLYPRSSNFANTVTFNNLITGAYSADKIVDMFTPFLDSTGTTYNAKYSNGSHWNYKGVGFGADILWNKLNSVLAPKQNYESPRLLFNKRYSENSLIDYPSLINDNSNSQVQCNASVTNSQTVLIATTSLEAAGFKLGYCLLWDNAFTSTTEVILITAIDYQSNTITCTRAQLGSTAQTFASAPYLRMYNFNMAYSGGTNHLMSIGNGGRMVIGSSPQIFAGYTLTVNTAGVGIASYNPAGGASTSYIAAGRSSTSGIAGFRLYTGMGTISHTFEHIASSTDAKISRQGASFYDIYLPNAGGTYFNTNTAAYKLTSGGGSTTAKFMFDLDNSVTSGTSYTWNSANGHVITIANGTDRIGVAGYKLINTNTTSGSETADLGLYTNNAGTGLNLRATVNSTGISTIHLQGASSTPTIVAGAGAGTSPTVSVTGTDMGGYITVTTGTAPTPSATVSTITFNVAYGSAPRCIQLTPANTNSALLSGVNMVYVDQAGITTTTFVVTAGTTALTSATTYKWYYSVIQ